MKSRIVTLVITIIDSIGHCWTPRLVKVVNQDFTPENEALFMLFKDLQNCFISSVRSSWASLYTNLPVGVQLWRHGDDGGGAVELLPAVHLLHRPHAECPFGVKVVDVLLLVGTLLYPRFVLKPIMSHQIIQIGESGSHLARLCCL